MQDSGCTSGRGTASSDVNVEHFWSDAKSFRLSSPIFVCAGRHIYDARHHRRRFTRHSRQVDYLAHFAMRKYHHLEAWRFGG